MMKHAVLSLMIVMLVGCMAAGLPLVAQAQYYAPQVQPPVYYQQNAAPQQYLHPAPRPVYPSVGYPCRPSGYLNNERCMYQQALQMVYARQYHGAIQTFAQFLQYYPQSSLADNALYWTGECYYAMKRYQIALTYFQRIPYQYPRGNKVPDSLLKTALSYFSMKQDARGCQALNQLLTRYPRSEAARKAHRWTNRCYSGGGSGGCYSPCYPSPYGTQSQGNPSYYGDYSFPKNY